MAKIEIDTGAGWIAFVLFIFFIHYTAKIDCAIGIEAACEYLNQSWIKE